MRDLTRCDWCLSDPLYISYHDHEWGVPAHNDQKQFEFLVLESAQAGLSWLTILKRRENYRALYEEFDPEKVARFDPGKINQMLLDPGIIRNRQKIEASVNNARSFLEIREQFGSFHRYLWKFTEGKQVVNRHSRLDDIPPNSPLSDAISKDMKAKGFRFLGSTIIYAHLQATGLINDHLLTCFRYSDCME